MSKMKPEFRKVAHGKQFDEFLDGSGVIADRERLAERFDYDHHARKLTFAPHFRGQVLMQAMEYESTRDHQWAAQHDPLFTACGADVEISVSGLAQANRNRPLEPLIVILQQVMDAVAQLPHRRLRALDKETWQGIVGLLHRVELFDATRLQLPPKVREWAPGTNEGSAALRLQLRVNGNSGSIRKLLLTPATGPDASYFERLLGDLDQQQGQFFVFDGGYWNVDTYHHIVESGNHFVTKLGGNVKPQVVEELPLPEEPLASGYVVLRDALVYLGDCQERMFRMLRVRLSTDEVIVLLTSLVERPADEICLLYRYRWTIEIIFRWLRQTLQLDHLMSHDPIGIVRQILMALIVWGLLVIANQDAGKLSPKQLWRELQASMHWAAVEFGYRLGLEDAELAF